MGPSTPGTQRVVGILAGGGSLPREVADGAAASGAGVQIVALEGEADGDFGPHPVKRIGWGQIGAMVRALNDAHCTELVIVGAVRRPDLGAVRPDLGLFLSLPSIFRIIAAGGDDGVLTKVIRFFEEKGFRVVAPTAVVPGLLVGEGPLGRVAPGPEHIADARLAFDLISRLGPFDVGQAVVATAGRIEAVEGAEGTDKMLKRLADVRGAARGTPRGVLVKRPKPGQEMRIDLPAIGPGTATVAAEAGLAGVVVVAGGVLAAGREELRSRADAAGLFVEGFPAGALPAPRAPKQAPSPLAAMTKRKPTARNRADATRGAGVLMAAEPLLVSQGAVVDRGYVLAVESGEGASALIARAGSLRQWGMRSKRSGVAVLREGPQLAAVLADGSAGALAGIAVLGEPSPALRDAARAADRLGIFLGVLSPPGKDFGAP
jgi:DUF1009 family protein